jgi:hypothetical protein
MMESFLIRNHKKSSSFLKNWHFCRLSHKPAASKIWNTSFRCLQSFREDHDVVDESFGTIDVSLESHTQSVESCWSRMEPERKTDEMQELSFKTKGIQKDAGLEEVLREKTDASGLGVGALLLQEDDLRKRHVIEYASKKFTVVNKDIR